MPVQSILEAFDLTRQQWLETAEAFREKVLEGLTKDTGEIKCLPTHVFPKPDQQPEGVSYALDLGGSNLRAGVLFFEEGATARFLGPVKSLEMPWKRNIPFSKNDFLDIQASLLGSLDYPEPCPLGYCFSYPAECLPDGDARLIRWTKGIVVPETLGKKMGRMLVDHIEGHYSAVKIQEITVINDTVACLFAGLTKATTQDAHIGLIVGTGNNLAAFFPSHHVGKLPRTGPFRPWVPVNLESGNFVPPYLTPWDHIVDEASVNPGEQRLEKAVSGEYLGRLFAAIFPESGFNVETGAKGLVDLMNRGSGEREEYVLIARAIYERSIRLVAAQLAGLIQALARSFTREKIGTVSIVAEGGLFWSKLGQKNAFATGVQTRLETLLAASGLPFVRPEFHKIQNANLMGAALAALSK
jgi:hexokinase